MDLRQIRYFVAVYEEGSFSKAAQRERCTQPGLSVHIQRLEAMLSQRLFERNARGVTATAAGRHFYACCTEVLSAVKTANQRMLDLAGSVAGSALAQKVPAVNRFGQPKTVIHVVAYKFRDATSQNDQEQAINGIRDMAGKIPGIKNIWLKTERNQIRDWSGVYAIEFVSPEAAADYAESPLHETWRKKWEALRETSVSFQISN